MASISKHLFFFLLFVITGFVGFSQGRKLSVLLDQEGTGGGVGGGASLQCVQKLIPCKPFLKEPEKASPICCLPLKQMVSDDTQCLCNLFNNSDMLSKLNSTQDDALKLSKVCDANADISVCKKDAASPSTSPASNDSSSSPSSSKSAAYAPSSHFGGSGFAALFVAVITAAAF